jgi:hypothetical protein
MNDPQTVLATVLVLITGYYAWQNRRVVSEMRKSRELSVEPKLNVSIRMLGPTYGVAHLMSTGQGPALDVDVTVMFHQRAGGPIERKWRSVIMPPGEAHDFIAPEELRAQTMDDFSARCSEISVRGTMKSSLGTELSVSETTGDLREWFEMTAAASHLWEEEPEREISREIEKIRKSLEKIVSRSHRG